MLSGSCTFSPFSCSPEPIDITIATSSSCEVTTTFNLPQKYGNPYVKFTTCEKYPCTQLERSASENIFIPVHHRRFTKAIDPTRTFYYEIAVRGDACLDEICLFPFNISMLGNCNGSQSHNFDATTPEVDKSENFLSVPILAGVLTVIMLLLAAFLVFLSRLKKKGSFCFKSTRKRPIVESSTSKELKNMPRVFVVFSDDDSILREVVLKFVAFLEAEFGFQIVLDLYDREKLYVDPVVWLEQSLTADKILVIWSTCSKSKLREITESHNYQMFGAVLKQIKDCLVFGRDTSKYIFVQLEYLHESLPSELCSDKISSFHLLSQFEDLVRSLAGEKKSWKTNIFRENSTFYNYLNKSDYGTALKVALSKMFALTNADSSVKFEENILLA